MDKAAVWWEGMDPAEAGRQVYEKRGCAQCHSIDGSGGIGPTLKGAFGARRQFADGSTGAADENYVRESILNPRAKVLAGFDPVMPTFQGRIKNDEIDRLIAFLKSLE
jgi:cytochrome c oxidase subunit 2